MVITWWALVFQGLICYLLKDTAWFAANTDALSWTVIIVTSMFFVLSVFLKQRDVTSMTVIFAGYFMRIAMLVWDMYFYHIFRFPGSGGDSEGFYRRALSVFEGSVASNRVGTYPRFLSQVFQLFGTQRVIAQYINILFGVTAVFIMIHILKKYKIDKPIVTAALAIGMLFPNYAIVSVALIREAIVTLPLTISLYFFLLWFKDGKIWGVAAAVLFVLLAAMFHSGAVAVAAGYAACIALYSRGKQAFRFKATTVIWVLICVFAFLIINELWGSTLFRKIPRVNIIQRMIRTVSSAARGSSGYFIYMNTGNDVMDIIVNTPVRMVYFLLSPLPWDWRGLTDIIAFMFNSTFYGYCYYAALKALKNKRNENMDVIILLLMMCLASAVVFAWGVSNAGTALRHRDKFFVQYLLMLSMCFGKRKGTNFVLLRLLRKYIPLKE